MFVSDFDQLAQFENTGLSSFRSNGSMFQTFIAESGATPLPIGFGYDALQFLPTGPVIIYTPIDELVAIGVKYISSVSAIPLSSEDEATVQAMLKRRLRPNKTRLLQK